MVARSAPSIPASLLLILTVLPARASPPDDGTVSVRGEQGAVRNVVARGWVGLGVDGPLRVPGAGSLLSSSWRQQVDGCLVQSPIGSPYLHAYPPVSTHCQLSVAAEVSASIRVQGNQR